VRGKNIRRGGNRRISFLDEVYVNVYGVSVRLLQRKVVLVSPPRRRRRRRGGPYAGCAVLLRAGSQGA